MARLSAHQPKLKLKPNKMPEAVVMREAIAPFKRWLSVWIALSMAAGLTLGWAYPRGAEAIGSLSVAEVNPVAAVLVWLLIVPSMVEVDYSQLASIWRERQWRRASALTLAINWVIKPLSLAIMGVVFMRFVFGDTFDASQADGYVAGLILLGVAPCAGMVFVWSRLTGGDPAFTLAQVSINNLVLLALFVPLAGLLMGMSGLAIPWATLALAVFAFVIGPAVFGIGLRLLLERTQAIAAFRTITGPMTKVGLLLLVVLLFSLQAGTILSNPLAILIITVPLLIHTALVFGLCLVLAKAMDLPASLAAPAALIGVSNFFELAVAIAIGVFGPSSPAVTATVVGVLVEVPAMLALVAVLNRARPLFEERGFVKCCTA